QYDVTQLTLFEGSTVTDCGPASSSVGPFYCPADAHVFIDLGFFRELATRFEAPGDFAQAYVIAHEFGHHVQNLLGTSGQVHDAQQANAENANELSIRLELQADCYAGAWGNSVKTGDVDAGDVVLEEGDVGEGIAAATAVGDDRLQREATGRINQETWTHGSSEQRVHWFNVGFESGDPDDCDTFSAADLG
ncbi:MAG: KPN_02809 family neutral zinc metallopeptidase, partial [Acidimicrobiales bacterium]